MCFGPTFSFLVAASASPLKLRMLDQLQGVVLRRGVWVGALQTMKNFAFGLFNLFALFPAHFVQQITSSKIRSLPDH